MPLAGQDQGNQDACGSLIMLSIIYIVFVNSRLEDQLQESREEIMTRNFEAEGEKTIQDWRRWNLTIESALFFGL
jgi:hypothetical protein